MSWWRDRWPTVFFLGSNGLLVGGAGAAVLGAGEVARLLWIAATVLGLAVSLVSTTRAMLHRTATVDVIAVLALAGALWVDEAFAGAMISVMLASGHCSRPEPPRGRAASYVCSSSARPARPGA